MRAPVIGIVLAAVLFLPAAASGGTSPRADLGFRFSSARPGTATGVRIYILYKNPSNPGGKPPAIRHVDIAPPPGSRFDPRALPACSASDGELLALGDAACPPPSRLGGGILTVITGIAPLDPYLTNVTVFSTADGWVELAKDARSGRPVGIDRLTFANGHLVESPPFEPGTPPDGAAVREVDFTLDPHASWATTPPTCEGAWTTRATFGFADGGTQAVADSMRCERPAARPRPPRRRRRRPRHARHRPSARFAG